MGDLLRMGVVESVDGRRCAVRVGELVSGPVPWFVGRAGKTIRWTRVSEGEQGLLICPEGEIAAGVFLPGALSTDFDTPTTDDVELIAFEDGAELRYDPAAHRLNFSLPEDGRFEITADVAITGAVTVTEGVTAQGDVVGQGVSLHSHVHPGVQGGGGSTLKPQATA